MPTQAYGVYAAEGTAGDQISSTYEGRHLTMQASELTHAGAVVTKGLPVVFGTVAGNHGVGIALNTEVAGTDLIAIDTEGSWNVSVVATDDAGNSLVTGGDPLYINTTTCIVGKIRNLVTQIPFGYALGQVAAAATAVIAVKVHWDPRQPQDEFAILTGAATDNAMSITTADQVAGAGIIGRGFHINYDNNGVKTGAQAESNGIGIDMDADANVTGLFGINVYTAGLTGATINRVAAYTCYLDNPAATINAISCIHLETAAAAATTCDYISMRSHALQDGILTFRSGGDVATYFLVFDPAIVQPCVAFNAAGNGDYSIKCYINGEITYLHTYDAP